MKEMFKMMDTDNSGTITFEELKAGLKRVGSDLMESEIHELMEAVCELFTLILSRVSSSYSRSFMYSLSGNSSFCPVCSAK